MIDDIIAILAILLMVGGAIIYIVKAKKKGQKCIGCPYSGSCGGSSGSGKCSCGEKTSTQSENK